MMNRSIIVVGLAAVAFSLGGCTHKDKATEAAAASSAAKPNPWSIASVAPPTTAAKPLASTAAKINPWDKAATAASSTAAK